MPAFRYKAKTAGGETRAAIKEAESASALAAELRRDGMVVLDVSEAKSQAAASPADRPRWHPSWLLRMGSLDVEMGLRQLASMLSSGVSVLVALKTVEEQSGCPRAAKVWRSICESVRSGGSISDSIETHRKIFSDEVVQLCRTGEKTGELDQSLTRAADQMEARRNLRMTVVNALIYPIIATLAAVGVSAYLVIVVIPKISEFLAGGNAQLPAITQMLMDLSAWLRGNYPRIIAAIVAAVAAWCATRRNPKGRELEDALLLKIPVAGKILRLSATASFSRGMALLVESGVPLIESLRVSAEMLANFRLRRRVSDAADAVTQGESLSRSLLPAVEFLPMLPRMTSVAEATGALAPTFSEIARFHETLLAITIRRFSVLMEPVMILVTGGIVGFVYVAFFMAIFSIAQVQ